MCSNKAPYRTLLRRGEAELIVNRSRFIGWAAPARTEEEALDLIAQARAAFRDASHHCYAYVVGVNRGIQRYSDAGEPQGTAGLPILDTLLRPDLTNCCAVVTRYFGGVLLGKGGLVRAYGQCAAAAVAAASPAEMVPTSRLLVEVPCTIEWPISWPMPPAGWRIRSSAPPWCLRFPCARRTAPGWRPSWRTSPRAGRKSCWNGRATTPGRCPADPERFTLGGMSERRNPKQNRPFPSPQELLAGTIDAMAFRGRSPPGLRVGEAALPAGTVRPFRLFGTFPALQRFRPARAPVGFVFP